LKDSHQLTFNQTIHVILGNGEKLIRRRKVDDTLIQTEKIDLAAGEEEIVAEEIKGEEIETEEFLFNDENYDSGNGFVNADEESD
jgi:hypothetical protein